MKINLRNSKGITLVALVITIIVLMIILSITIYEGKNIIQESKMQKNITNMLSIKSKIKGYSEEIDSSTWNASNTEMDETKTTKTKKEAAKETKFSQLYSLEIDSSYSESKNIFANNDEYASNVYEKVYYNITNEALTKMNLSSLIDYSSENSYKVVFATDSNGDYVASDIIYLTGFKYNEVTYYTLSEMQEISEEE